MQPTGFEQFSRGFEKFWRELGKKCITRLMPNRILLGASQYPWLTDLQYQDLGHKSIEAPKLVVASGIYPARSDLCILAYLNPNFISRCAQNTLFKNHCSLALELIQGTLRHRDLPFDLSSQKICFYPIQCRSLLGNYFPCVWTCACECLLLGVFAFAFVIVREVEINKPDEGS